MGRKTRKVSKTFRSSKGMSIPQLRKAFEHMDKFRDINTFRKEWKKTFGKEVSKDAAEDYLKFVSTTKRGQHGGMAPLDYQVRAGADSPTSGYPPYVASGFRIPEPGMNETCGKETWPVPAGDMGSNCMKGGRRKSVKGTRRKQKGGALPSMGTVLEQAFTRPFGTNSPHTIGQDVQMLYKGVNTLTSPRPEINNLEQYNPSAHIYKGSVNPVSRTW